MGDSISEGVVESRPISCCSDVGDYVEADEIVARIETDKVTVDILSQHSGVIKKYFAEEGDTVEVGGDFFEIDTDAKGSSTPAAAPKEEAPAQQAAAEPTPTPEAPKQATPPPAPKAAAPPQAAPQAAPKGSSTTSTTAKKAPTEISGTRTETRVRMSKLRQTISRRLKESQNTNASLTTFNEIDMGDYIDIRKEIQEAFLAKHGVKLGFMSAFMKASTQALKE